MTDRLNSPRDDGPFGTPGRILMLGAWCGLVTGFGELIFLAARKFIKHKFLFVSPDVLWMAPLLNVMIFVVIGLLITGLRQLLPGRI
jgi:hypothetical protein